MYSIIDVRTGKVLRRARTYADAEDWIVKHLGDDRYATERKYFEIIGGDQ